MLKTSKRETKLKILVTVVLLLTISSSVLIMFKFVKPSRENDVLHINMAEWSYDEEHNVYYKQGLCYCTNPVTRELQVLNICVPGNYFIGTKKPDDLTYFCTLRRDGKVGNFNCLSAPTVFKVVNINYSHSGVSAYKWNDVAEYIENGFVYVAAGYRGLGYGEISTSSPNAVVDLKAAVRYIKYNDSVLPGTADNIYALGRYTGATLVSVLGATGNSPHYDSYLKEIGAPINYDIGETDGEIIHINDELKGVMLTDLKTGFDTADLAYEWLQGAFSNSKYRADGSFYSEFSRDMSTAYAKYVNELGLRGDDGSILSLTQNEQGQYYSGSYYDAVLSVYENSLSKFLNNSKYPLIFDNSTGRLTDKKSADKGTSYTTYKTARAYVDYLNGNDPWIDYNDKTGLLKFRSLKDFSQMFLNADFAPGIYDNLYKDAPENLVFSKTGREKVRFNRREAIVIEANARKYMALTGSNNSTPFLSGFISAVSDDITERVNLFNAIYFLVSYYNGAGSSTVSKNWKIVSGAFQKSSAQATDINLYIALKNLNKNVTYDKIWASDEAYFDGNTNYLTNKIADSEFIKYVIDCNKKQDG